MTNEIRKELILDIQKMCKMFGIEKAINEDIRDEITAEQYEKMKFPIVFYNIYIAGTGVNRASSFARGQDRLVSSGDSDKKYLYDEEIQVILTLESRDRSDKFNELFLFLTNGDATNDFFKSKKTIRKIRKCYQLQDTTTEYKGRRYYRQVLQFSYYANYEMKF